MEKELLVTPEELYYMGRLLQAKYIDYAYIAAMGDIKQNYSLFEKEAQASLVAAGILLEDFGGNLEVEAEALSVLRPLFFGEVESSVDICTLGEENTVSVNKFHFHDGAVTMVSGADGKLSVRAVDQMAIRNFVAEILPQQYDGAFAAVEGIDNDKITRYIAVKNIEVGKAATVKIYIESDGILYRETAEAFESLTRDMFIDDAYGVAKGV